MGRAYVITRYNTMPKMLKPSEWAKRNKAPASKAIRARYETLELLAKAAYTEDRTPDDTIARVAQFWLDNHSGTDITSQQE